MPHQLFPTGYSSDNSNHGPGHKESSADIAYNLSQCHDIKVVTPVRNPNPTRAEDWCFPDTEEGILAAVAEHGARFLWANTNLFDEHPLQVSRMVGLYDDKVRVVGHSPVLQQDYEHKAHVSTLLRTAGSLRIPQQWDLSNVGAADLPGVLEALELRFPVVAKPVRGRGGWGVKVCRDLPTLCAHLRDLKSLAYECMLEQYLSGEEASVVVLPPRLGAGSDAYYCLGPKFVTGHQDGVAPGPWNPPAAAAGDSDTDMPPPRVWSYEYEAMLNECEIVARCLGALAPIRIDVRRFTEEGRFAIFDVNMWMVGHRISLSPSHNKQ